MMRPSDWLAAAATVLIGAALLLHIWETNVRITALEAHVEHCGCVLEE